MSTEETQDQEDVTRRESQKKSVYQQSVPNTKFWEMICKPEPGASDHIKPLLLKKEPLTESELKSLFLEPKANERQGGNADPMDLEDPIDSSSVPVPDCVPVQNRPILNARSPVTRIGSSDSASSNTPEVIQQQNIQ